MNSSQPSDEDDKQPFLEPDWRSFRARLVAAEQQQQHQPESQITIGHKWAHLIHEPEKGCLLVATEKLDGVHIFERTVILLLSTGPIGPVGIILNRPSLMSIKEMRSPVLKAEGTFSDRPLFFGGPLDDGLFLLNPAHDEVENSGVFEKVMKGLYYGTKESVGCAAEMVKRNAIKVENFRFFDGCCGWEKEQLNEEIRAGYWALVACSPNVIGMDCVGTVGLWDEVNGLMGPKKVW